jgi:hypothetical protein
MTSPTDLQLYDAAKGDDRVTLKPKCYVFVCAGCDGLSTSERSDALTCSGACRVRAHRNSQLKVTREQARSIRVPPALLQQCAAIERLRPDLAQEIAAGRLDAEDTRADVYRAYLENLEKLIAEDNGGAPNPIPASADFAADDLDIPAFLRRTAGAAE